MISEKANLISRNLFKKSEVEENPGEPFTKTVKRYTIEAIIFRFRRKRRNKFEEKSKHF
jgi:hypothetical protein